MTEARFAKLWGSFWAQADRVGPVHDQHYVWRGAVDRRGQPIFAVGARDFPAGRLAWVYHRRFVPVDEDPRPTCGRKLCIRPDHQTVRSSRA